MTTPDTSHVQETVDTALYYAARYSWRVLPLHAPVAGHCTCAQRDCSSPGKHPLGALVPSGVLDASDDQDTILQWWQRRPWANVGIATGQASGFVVLDVDLPKGGEDSLAEIYKKHGPIPDTPCAITGNGFHFLFAYPGRAVQNKAAIAPGLDVRGDNGYIVAPPSLHASGRRYAWDLSAEPETTPLAPLPGWFATAAAKQPVAPPIPSEGRITANRNVTLARVAGALRRVGVAPDDLAPMIAVLNERRCDPPLGVEEIEKIARSVGRYQEQPAAAPILRTVSLGT